MSQSAKSRLFYLSFSLFFVFLLGGFILPTLEAEGVKAAEADKAAVPARPGSVPAYTPASLPSSGLNLPERESVFSPLPSAAWAAPYQTTANQKLIEVLWATTEKAGSFARNVSQTLGDYVKEKQIEVKQQELIRRFYEQLDGVVRPMRLAPPDYEELVRRVEQVYIEDGETGAFKLDTAGFRDLPVIVKAQHAEMLLKRVSDGTVETYYPDGALKTRWTLAGGKLNGPATTYYEDGEILYIDLYREGMKVHRRKFNPEGKLDFEQAYDYAAPAVSAAVPQAVPEVPAPAAAASSEPSQTQTTASDPAEVLPVI